MTPGSNHRVHLAILVAGVVGLAGGVALIAVGTAGVNRALSAARHQGALAMRQGMAFVDRPSASPARAEFAHLAARRAAFRQVAAAERDRALGVLLALAGLLTATTGYALDHLQRNVADLEAMRLID